MRDLVVVLAALTASISSSAQQRAIDAQKSSLTVHVYRTGLFSFAGDNHEVRAPLAAGTVSDANHSVEFSVDARTLQVLDPNLAPEKRAQVQEKMLGPDVLDSQRFPDIKFQGSAMSAEKDGRLQVQGTLSLHGQSRPMVVNVNVLESGHYKGSAELKQSDFGIKPISIAGGTVKVKNELRIDFDIFTRP
jgi:polyisoprenoid-binding protein YceI